MLSIQRNTHDKVFPSCTCFTELAKYDSICPIEWLDFAENIFDTLRSHQRRRSESSAVVDFESAVIVFGVETVFVYPSRVQP